MALTFVFKCESASENPTQSLLGFMTLVIWKLESKISFPSKTVILLVVMNSASGFVGALITGGCVW